MSRWSADYLRIALAPGEIAFARGSRKQSWTADTPAASLLPVLDAALAEPIWKAARVEVVLSQHFVRHVLTPPPGKALSPDEETTLVTASLHDLYGDLAKNWRVSVHSQPPHLGVLGAAVDGAFAGELDALLKRHGFHRVRILPLAAMAIRRLPAHMAGWWLLAEPGWVTLLGGTPSGWLHVSGMPADAGWQEHLADWVAYEGDCCTAPIPPAAWLQAVGVGSVDTPRDALLRWQVLPHENQIPGAAALLAV